MSYAQRLTRVAKIFGCEVHEEALTCPTCQPYSPYPEPVARGMDTFIESIIARRGREALRAAALGVPRPPIQDTCARCDTMRQCWRCQVRYSETLFRAIGLTEDERTTLANLRAMCRRLDLCY